MIFCQSCKRNKEAKEFGTNEKTKALYKTCSKCRSYAISPTTLKRKAERQRTRTIEKRIERIEKYFEQNPEVINKTFKCTYCKEYKDHSHFGINVLNGKRYLRCITCRNRFQEKWKRRMNTNTNTNNVEIVKTLDLHSNLKESQKKH